MERYQRGKVYRIVCRKTGKQYIGSTCKKLLSQRLAHHVCVFKAWKKGNFNFITSFEVLKENDYYIELVELVVVNSKDELLVRERFHIQNTENVNMIIPLRTQKEYYEDNKEQLVEKKHIYYEANKEIFSEKSKIYYKKNKEQIIQKVSSWNQEHKEQIAKYNKEYYKSNKEKWKNTETFTCICGTISTICNKTRHEKTIKHQNHLKNIASKSLGELCCVIENGENIQVK